MRRLRPGFLLLVLPFSVLLLGSPRAFGADPQPYAVHIGSTGNGALNAALAATSQLLSLRKSAPVGPFALVDRAQQDIGRLQTVLGSFGYYRASITIRIDGHPLQDAELPNLLQALPARSEAKVEVAIATGPLFHLGKVAVEGSVSRAALAAFGLKSGAPAVAADVLAARQRLLTALEGEGHAFATVSDPTAYEDATRPLLDISLTADPGATYVLGPIRFEGLRRVKETFVRGLLKLQPGQRYSPAAVETARTGLLGLGVFASVTVRLPSPQQASNGVLPLTFVVVEGKRHSVGLNGEYSSDLGIIAGASWTDHDLLGHAEQLTLHANVIDLGGTSTTGAGYDIGAQFTKPDFRRPDQSLQFTADALEQHLLAYTQIAGTVGTSLSRQISRHWNVAVGANLEEEKFSQTEMVNVVEQSTADGPQPREVSGCTRAFVPLPAVPAASLPAESTPPPATWCHFTLLGVPLSARYDSTGLTNPLLDPTHGERISVSVQPTESLSSSESAKHATFVIMQGNASYYFDFAGFGWSQPGRTVLALRAVAGEASGASQFSLPPDQRFYAGGSATVRGYAYESISPWFGPPDAAGEYPQGGTGLAAGTIELRQRVGANFGFAVFVDAGQVSTRPGPLNDSGAVGVNYASGIGYGLGPRYYTPIGPIRVDVAFPARHLPNESAFEAYIGLGQAF